MTPEMKAFLNALADLIEEHGVGLTAVDDGVDYYPSVDGVEISMMGRWDDSGDSVRDFCEVRTGIYLDQGSLRKLADSDT